MKKTFRGLLKDGDVQQIRLSTNNGLTGYRISKFELLSEKPGDVHNENVVQIYSTGTNSNGVERTANNDIDFNDPTLLAAGFYRQDASRIYMPSANVIFDDKTFNQDIFITNKIVDEVGNVNYLIELEQVKLSKDEATVATLKDMRAGPDTNFGP